MILNLRTWTATLLTTAVLLGPVVPAGAAEPSRAETVADEGRGDAPRPEAIVETVRDHVATHMTDAHVPGMAFAIVDADGVVAADAFGVADLSTDRPMRLDTPLRVGSISKPVTAALALTLADADVLDLDTPADRTLDVDLDDAHGPASTVRQLLRHRGGYPDAFVSTHHVDPSDAPTFDEWIRTVPDRPLPPGVVPSYSSVGYTVAGAAIAGTTDRSFADAADRWLFTPLAMSHATFRQPPPSDVAIGYRWHAGGYVPFPVDVPELVPGVGLTASATDVAAFMTAVLDDDGPLPATVRDGLLTVEAVEPGLRGASTGLTEWRYDDRATLYHEGNGIGTTSRMEILPDAGVGIFTAVTGEALVGMGDPSSQTRFVRDLHERLIAAYLPGPATLDAGGSTGNQSPTDQVAGWYVPTRLDPASPLRLEALVAPLEVRQDARGVVIDGTRYDRIGRGVHEHGTDTAVFVDDPAGRPSVTFGGTASYRQAAWWETRPVAIATLGGALIILLAGLATAIRSVRGVQRWLLVGQALLALTFVAALGVGVATLDAMTLFTALPPGIRVAQVAVAGVAVTSVAVAVLLVGRRRSGVALRGVVAGAAVVAAGLTISAWAWLWRIIPV